jgi:hypothetical protein
LSCTTNARDGRREGLRLKSQLWHVGLAGLLAATLLPPPADPDFTAQVVEVLEDQADRYSLLVQYPG